MHNSHMPREGIVPREEFLHAHVTAHLLLAVIVYRVLVPCQVVAAAEDRVARFARAGIDALALVRARGVVPRGVVLGRLEVLG